ncbi:hypothetical protein DICSQDRAFT_98906 [Dichomitus squalens LYAD-421 SS1]|uniref:uncharacterized protein n=1 Tax=Dichomitus squalens (strain LYAD-421) TaxID=732165 RepID=UPI0004413FF0|nr:uncharacterized protein DICSQDRAFT_98906 [Dichomitus squalens LYAD-421 SS1]EJF65242.1 hypothetical protein DICSQDRAFT_98906 [Dichomitus squalens LYAD-421 SS1]
MANPGGGTLSESTLIPTLVGALEGSISVLLTLFSGFVMAKIGYLDHKSVRHITKLCTNLFLPCLIIEAMGPDLTLTHLSKDWIIPIWGLASTLLAHAIGYVGHRVMKLPYWTIAACGRPNSNVLPLLLLQSLDSSGVLGAISRDGEGSSTLLRRAKSLILLNAVVQQTFTFQLVPGIIARDKPVDEDAVERQGGGQDRLRPGPGRINPALHNAERVGLLDDIDHHPEDSDDSERTRTGDAYRHALDGIADRPDYHWPHRLQFLENPVKNVAKHVSPVLLSAVVAFIIGATPPLHHAILDGDGVLYSSLTQSVINLGELFVALQAFTVGAELALVKSSDPGKLPTVWVLFVRFIVMPGLALLFVFLSAGRGLYVDDRLVWFLLVLIPAGPSAMLLVSVAELVNVDQGEIAGYLTVSYLFSPLMALVCSSGLSVVATVAKRVPGM